MSKSQNPLKVADRYLLSPYGLGEAEIEKTFRKLMRHDIDFADLYFQYQRSEAWSLEEVQVILVRWDDWALVILLDILVQFMNQMTNLKAILHVPIFIWQLAMPINVLTGLVVCLALIIMV